MPTSVDTWPTATCRRCTSPANPRHEFCFPCALEVRSGVPREVLAELGRYWERRLMEGREKDWT